MKNKFVRFWEKESWWKECYDVCDTYFFAFRAMARGPADLVVKVMWPFFP